MFVSGAVSGTLLDGIHSRAQLQVYELWPLDIGGLHSSLAVPPLLGLFYVLLGGLVILADDAVAASGDEATAVARQRASNPAFVALCFGVLALLLQLSATCLPRVPFNIIFGVLGTGAAINFAALDGTKQGLALAAVCALGAPLAEVILLHFVPIWTYPRADVDILGLGPFVSWVPWCYFFYTPALSSLARLVWQASRSEK